MILTQPRLSDIHTLEWHVLPLPSMCPVSGNPQPGSVLIVLYQPVACYLEVYSLRQHIHSFIGGKDAIRDMEGAVQQIAQDCAEALKTLVTVGAVIRLQRGDTMLLMCQGVA